MAIYYKGNKITSVAVSTSTSGSGREQVIFQYADFSKFPTTATTKAIYIDLSTNQAYCWNGQYLLLGNVTDIEKDSENCVVKIENLPIKDEEARTLISNLEASVSNKADASHNHDDVYAPINHTHELGEYVKSVTFETDIEQGDLLSITKQDGSTIAKRVHTAVNSLLLNNKSLDTIKDEINQTMNAALENKADVNHTHENLGSDFKTLIECDVTKDTDEKATEYFTTNYRTMIGQETTSQWYGATAVPNNAYVETMYFNKDLRSEEVVDIIENADLDYTADGKYYVVYSNEKNYGLFIEKQEGLYALKDTNDSYYFAFGNNAKEIAGFEGWSTSLLRTYSFNSNVVNNVNGVSVGTKNEALKLIFSITSMYLYDIPSVKYYELNEDGSLNKDKPIEQNVLVKMRTIGESYETLPVSVLLQNLYRECFYGAVSFNQWYTSEKNKLLTALYNHTISIENNNTQEILSFSLESSSSSELTSIPTGRYFSGIVGNEETGKLVLVCRSGTKYYLYSNEGAVEWKVSETTLYDDSIKAI